MDAILRELGFAICHQLPERTLNFGSRGLFVCARDTGLATALFLGLVILCLPRNRSARWPAPGIWAASAILFGLFAFDALTSYAGWRETSNALRLLSGLAAGAALAVPLSVLINRYVRRAGEGGAAGFRYPLFACGLALLAALFLARPAWAYLPAQLLTAASVLGVFLALNLIIVGSLADPGRRLARLLPPALLLVVIELAAGNRLHALFS
ncbi:MAG: DUF2085 domain-containing protein [Candidatus Geothermincolia bacterium]